MTVDTSPAVDVARARRSARAGDRPAPAGRASTALTFGWRALLKIKHVPEQLGDVVGIPIIFTLLFTYLFGGAVEGSPRNYLHFLLPGSLVMTVLMVSMYSGIGLNADITRGVFDRFRTLPIWRPAPVVGALIGDTGRYLLASAIILGLGTAMGFRPEGGVSGMLAGVALVILFAFGLGWVWSTLGLLLRSPASVMNIGMLVLFPLSFASNAFVDPGTLPGWLHAFVDVNPVSYLVTAERGLMYGAAPGADILVVLLAAAGLTAVFAPVTARLYRNRG